MRDEDSNRYPIMVMIKMIRKDPKELIYLCYSPSFLGILYQLHPLFKSITIINKLIFRR